MVDALLSDEVIDAAYLWLCKRRRDYPQDADVWWLRFHWPRERARLRADLRAGRYGFEPLTKVTNTDGETLHLWSARDAAIAYPKNSAEIRGADASKTLLAISAPSLQSSHAVSGSSHQWKQHAHGRLAERVPAVRQSSSP